MDNPTVASRNTGEVVTQDNVYKSAFQLPDTENLAGNESGESTTAGYGTTTGKQSTSVEYAITDTNQRNGTSQPYLNISASEENRSAKWKHGEAGPAFSPGAGEGQYQGK